MSKIVLISVLSCFINFYLVSYVHGRYVPDVLPENIIESVCDFNNEGCMPIKECPFFNELLLKSPKPRPRHVITLIRQHLCGFSSNVPQVCCSKLPTTTPKQTLFASDDIRNHLNYALLAHDKCGPILVNTRITSGEETAIGEYPWMALIAYFIDDKLDFRCGGTVITEKYVLTAAHCIYNTSPVGVRLGEHDISKIKDCNENGCAEPVQDFYIENVVMHPSYNTKTYVNDIALIKLLTRADFSKANVRPICLPIDPAGKQDLVGKYPIVSGWGVTEYGVRSFKLLKVSIPVLPDVYCKKLYQHFSPMTEKQICAGGTRGKDSCGGDSGGPLIHVAANGMPKYIQYGIVSYGPRQCGASGQPAVYTKVSEYVGWILNNINE